ncbi:hypothetical protein [Entomobacter blattae]
MVENILAEHDDTVEQYKNEEDKVFGFFVGQGWGKITICCSS